MNEDYIKKILYAIEQLKANIALGKYPESLESSKSIYEHTLSLDNINKNHLPNPQIN